MREASGPARGAQGWRRRVARPAPAPTPRAGSGQRRPPWRTSSSPGRKLVRHRGSFLEGPTGLGPRAPGEPVRRRARSPRRGARQAHGRARLSFEKEGRAFTRLARRGRSKARARASSVSFGQAPAGMAAASAVEPAPRQQLRARRSSPLRGPITRPYLRSGLSSRRLHLVVFLVRAPAPGARTHRRQAARRARPQAPAHSLKRCAAFSRFARGV